MSNWKETQTNPNYMVSDDGRIRRKGCNKDKYTREKNGYMFAELYHHGDKQHVRVHRMVAEAFIPNPEGKPHVNHIDGNKTNNHVSNLEWVTNLENIHHAWNTGLCRPSYGMKGKTNPNGGRKGIPIRIIETGEVFNSIEECGNAIDGESRRISDCLHGHQRTHRGYHFEYA